MAIQLSNRYFRAAVVYALIGMLWGLFMGVTKAYDTHPAHAHLLLLGWVSMTIYGVVFRLVPKAAEGILPQVHFWLVNAGVVIMAPGVALIHTGQPTAGDPLAAVGSILTIAGMVLFALQVWRGTDKP
ncbi:MAG: cytochrome-c oxidase [Alphaproteobacteria bacterium]|nr:cytochrome-c oxidase [Alphaproteobacteria bacterium]